MTMTSRRVLKYAAATVIAIFLSSGATIAAFLDCGDRYGYRILWFIVPCTALFLLAAAVNSRVLVPRLFLRQRYLSYTAATLTLCYLVPIVAFAMEWAMRECLGMGHRINDYTSGWILLDALSSCVLIFMLLIGMPMSLLYRRWRSQQRQEERAREVIDSRISLLRNRLNPGHISHALDSIIRLADTSPDEANREIRDLSAYLRHQLYELPDEPAFPQSDDADGMPSDNGRFSIAAFIAAPRYRVLRHLVFQLIIATVAFGAFFDTPDRPVFSLDRLEGVISFYVVLNVLAYANIYLLFPLFLRRGKTRLYAISLVAVVAALGIISITVQVATYEPSPYRHGLPLAIMSLSTAGSIFTLLLYLGGTASLMYLKKWISGKWRLTELKAETARYELEFLRRQINPHFLFNVLNNAGILIYEESGEAGEMLQRLRDLLQYQLSDARRPSTTLGAEASFLRDYLSLEKTRRDPFDYTLDIAPTLMNRSVPTLLFIPFVENAVKYSSVVEGMAFVEVSFSPRGNDSVEFTCRNTYIPDGHTRNGVGGIGLHNTLRRLQLLFGDRFTLRQHLGNETIHGVPRPIFTTILIIPLQKHES